MLIIYNFYLDRRDEEPMNDEAEPEDHKASDEEEDSKIEMIVPRKYLEQVMVYQPKFQNCSI